MPHSSNHRDNAALSTLMALVVVLASAGASAWWWTRGVRLQLSPLLELAGRIGLTSPQRPEVGYVPTRSLPVPALDGAVREASLGSCYSSRLDRGT